MADISQQPQTTHSGVEAAAHASGSARADSASPKIATEFSNQESASTLSEDTPKELHSANQDFNQSIEFDPNTNKEHGFIVNLLSRFLNDKWALRKIFALGNEIAESTKEALYDWLPKPIASTFYWILWNMAFFCTGSRVVMNAYHAPKEDKLKAGTKLFLHDIVSAISMPALTANVANWIQNVIYNGIGLNKNVKNVLRSALSLAACNWVIDKLDPWARHKSAGITGLHDDHHKVINKQQLEKELAQRQDD